MQNNSTFDYNSIDIVKYYIYEYFGEENISDSTLAFIVKVGLSLIGSKYQSVFKYSTKVLKSGREYLIPIPCNLEAIEAITLNNVDEYTRYNRHDLEVFQASFILPYISVVTDQVLDSATVYLTAKDTKEYFVKGTSINFTFLGDKVQVDKRYEGKEVNILYRGTLSDKDGQPLITNAEARALAFYWFYTNELKKVATRKGGDAGILQLAAQQKDEWISKARIPELLTQNELTAIKDAVKRRSFPSYGKTMKFGI